MCPNIRSMEAASSRIVDAMRRSVAARGAAGATFDHVAREAGVSRGLLHYYFGTKEKLLAEVVKRDADIRMAALDRALEEAHTADEVIEVLVHSLEDLVERDPGFVALMFELFTSGRRNPEIAPSSPSSSAPPGRGWPSCWPPGRSRAPCGWPTSPRRSPPCCSRSPTASPCGCWESRATDHAAGPAGGHRGRPDAARRLELGISLM